MSSSSPTTASHTPPVVIKSRHQQTSSTVRSPVPAGPSVDHASTCSVEEARSSPVIFTGRRIGCSKRFAIHQHATGRLLLTLDEQRRNAEDFVVKMVFPDRIESLSDGQIQVAACTKCWNECDAEDRASALEAQHEENLQEWASYYVHNDHHQGASTMPSSPCTQDFS